MEKIIRKSLLYKSRVEYGDFCINHVEGCAHGCKFPCYAMLLKRRSGAIDNYREWIKPRLVSNALELLRKELPRLRDRIQYVHLCFSTDPFMFRFPQVEELSLEIIEELNKNKIRTVVLTKGLLPSSLVSTDRFGAENDYGITLVSLNSGFEKAFEPNAAPYSDRIAALHFLHANGLKTWVSIEPYPTPNIVNQNLKNILNRISFVDKIVFGKMNYNPLVRKYKDWEGYYEECTEIVLDFCRTANIEVHIKKGTSIRYRTRNKASKVRTSVQLNGVSQQNEPTLFDRRPIN